MKFVKVMQMTFFHEDGTLLSCTVLPEKHAYGCSKALKRTWLFRIQGI